MENIRMTNGMDMECYYIRMVQNIKEISTMVWKAVKDIFTFRNLKKLITMKDNSWTIKGMDMELLSTKTDPNMKEIS